VIRFMAAADLRREFILAEIECEPYRDEEEGQDCLLISDGLLHQLLVKARNAVVEQSLPYEEDPRLESDAFPYFGVSQQTGSQDDGDRSARAERRGSAHPATVPAAGKSAGAKNGKKGH
jgi:hypothetical protein